METRLASTLPYMCDSVVGNSRFPQPRGTSDPLSSQRTLATFCPEISLEGLLAGDSDLEATSGHLALVTPEMRPLL